jgi:hypothetical protein
LGLNSHPCMNFVKRNDSPGPGASPGAEAKMPLTSYSWPPASMLHLLCVSSTKPAKTSARISHRTRKKIDRSAENLSRSSLRHLGRGPHHMPTLCHKPRRRCGRCPLLSRNSTNLIQPCRKLSTTRLAADYVEAGCHSYSVGLERQVCVD